MRANLENNLARNIRQMSGTYGIVEGVLTAAYRIAADGPTIHVLDANGAARTVFLPAISAARGQYYFISNISGSFNLNVVDSNGVAVTTVGANSSGIFFSYRSGWRYLVQGGGTLSSMLEDATGTSLSTYNITSESTLAIVRNNPATTAVNLPSYTTRINVGPITVLDWSSNVVQHLITVTPNGAERIMNATSYTVMSNANFLATATFWPSASLNGWFMR